MSDRVSLSGSGGKREVNYSVGGAQLLRRLVCYKLSCSRYFEGYLLYCVCQAAEVASSLSFYSAGNNTGTRNADVNYGIGLAYTVHCARHKGIIVGNVRENNELCASDRVSVACEVCGFEHRFAHDFNRIHIDARLC